MNSESRVLLCSIKKSFNDAIFRSVISDMENHSVRGECGAEFVDALLHLVDIRLAFLRFVRLEVIDELEVWTLIAVEGATNAFARRMGTMMPLRIVNFEMRWADYPVSPKCVLEKVKIFGHLHPHLELSQ
jgi:hypothetical protein